MRFSMPQAFYEVRLEVCFSRLADYGRSGASLSKLLRVLTRQTDYGRSGAKLVFAIPPEQADYGRSGGIWEVEEVKGGGCGPSKSGNGGASGTGAMDSPAG